MMKHSFIQRINPHFLNSFLLDLGLDPKGKSIIEKKSHDFVFKIFSLPLSSLHILKQEAISVGADLATPKDAILCQKSHYDVILLGSKSQILRVIEKCLLQPFGLREIAQILKTHLKVKKSVSPKLMAIFNLTPDSFFEGSRFNDQNAIQKIKAYSQLNIPIIDIGGASSRPSSQLITPQEELKRIKNLVLLIFNEGWHKKIRFSIDTYNPEVADFALSHGFKIVNDILGFSNPDMIKVCAKHKASAILMHSKGVPENMQSLAYYKNIFEDLDLFFERQINKLQSNGISDIILDIGFGFAKNIDHNLNLIQHLLHFKHFGLPLLVGASRKNTIGLLTNQPTHKRLSGTLALHQIALQNGADLLRVHDVEEHLDMLAIHNAINQS